MGRVKVERDCDATNELTYLMKTKRVWETNIAQAAELGVTENALYVWRQHGVPASSAERVHRAYRRAVAGASPNVCRYRAAVDCEDVPRRCDKCGWNPEVEEQRIKEWRDGRRIWT